jgi:hypothetical protein
MRRILDSLTWVFVILAVATAVYFTSTKTDVSAGIADHNHRSEAQRRACHTCRYDIGIEEPEDVSAVDRAADAPAADRTAQAF